MEAAPWLRRRRRRLTGGACCCSFYCITIAAVTILFVLWAVKYSLSSPCVLGVCDPGTFSSLLRLFSGESAATSSPSEL